MSRGVATNGPRRGGLAKVALARSRGRGGVDSSTLEALGTMSANKSSESDGPSRLGPLAASMPSPASRPERGPGWSQAPTVMQEKVLAEIAHELGNFFHKLYYWSDYLKERPALKSADSTAAQMLESTIRNLEGFLKVSLDYFHPTQLAFTRMPVPELLEGLLFQVRANLNGTSVAVAGQEPWPEASVLVDPSHLSRAFEVAVRHLTLHLGSESSVRVGIEQSVHGERVGLEVGFHVEQPNEASPLFRTAEAGVEWAVAQKVVALHGGELAERTEERGGKGVVIFLPLCP